MDLRRRGWVFAAAGLALLAGVAVLASATGERDLVADESDRPNVVVIMADDQTLAQLSALPRTEALVGAEGLTFTDAVVSYPLCCPSRATFFTGQYTQNNGVRSNGTPVDALPRPGPDPDADDGLEAWSAFAADGEDRSIAVALEAAGYRTGLLGKYLNGYGPDAPVPPGWTDWRAEVGQSARYYSTQLNVNGSIEDLSGRFQTDAYAEMATEMIEAGAVEGSPFFYVFSFSAPHVSTDESPTYAERHADLYDGVLAPRGPAFDEGTSQKPSFLRRIRPAMDAATQEDIDRRWRDSLRSLASLDEAVASIVDTLEETGELDDTVLFFTSDNGQFYGEHRVSEGKFLPYEPAVRVPLLVHGPVIPQANHGREVDEAVANVDLAPTILDLAGVEPLAPVDGRSLRPLLLGEGGWEGPGDVWDPAPTRSRPVYLVGIGVHDDTEHTRRVNVTYSGVRSSDGWMYVRWEDGPGTVELYDLEADPDQLDNLAGDPASAGIEARLEAQRRRLVRCAGFSCDVPPYGYLDLPAGEAVPGWFAPAQWGDARELGVAFADGTFRPREDLRRDHAVLWLWRSAGSPPAPTATGYADVPARLRPAVAWAVDVGLVPATVPDRRFRPAEGLARVELARWLWVLAGRPSAAAPLPTDVPSDSPTATAVRWLLSDLAQPLADGTFRPLDVVDRATAITWIHRSAT